MTIPSGHSPTAASQTHLFASSSMPLSSEISLDSMPYEIFLIIFSFLNRLELLPIRLVNRQWKAYLESEYNNLKLISLLCHWLILQKPAHAPAGPIQLQPSQETGWIINKEQQIKYAIINEFNKVPNLSSIFQLMHHELSRIKKLYYSYKEIQGLIHLKNLIKEKLALYESRQNGYKKQIKKLVFSIHQTADPLLNKIDALISQMNHLLYQQLSLSKIVKLNRLRLKEAVPITLSNYAAGLKGKIWFDHEVGLIIGVKSQNQPLVCFNHLQDSFKEETSDGSVSVFMYESKGDSIPTFTFQIRKKKLAAWAPLAKEAFEKLEQEQTQLKEKLLTKHFQLVNGRPMRRSFYLSRRTSCFSMSK